ncbi:hypothetical protein [Granulicella sibirica]|uniref:Uncharacterized protein n=1 Tax=Granulicella sibirica TaxID=2479048 RepID=A0A4Q0T587_9BACT|nr:hypothetical protein [Granulicella sibirica]RXH56776.1 hypothetical protein GRAN_0086 [Granulicella sibirica]
MRTFSPRPSSIVSTLRLIAASMMLPVALSGCHAGSAPAGSGTVSAHEASLIEVGRQQMELIPPPSKNRYMAIHSLASWENPYLTVQGDMVTLHVLLADANTSDLGQGTLLRPVGARRQDLNVRVSDLPTALNAVPSSAWPYGRVVALEEANNTPASARPQVRRNMESAMQVLNDLGVVVYEWNEGGAGLR